MTKSVNPATISVPELHGFLLGAVAPRPIAFASTIDRDGNINLSPFSFFNVFSANPPIMIFSPARRGLDNTTKHTYENLLEIPETVINIVNHPMVEQMSLTSTEYARGVNEFEKAGFTQVASEKVRPPRVGESPVSFECTVDEIRPLGDQGGAGNLVICRVVMIHLQEKYLTDEGKLDTPKLDLVGRMGGSWYTRANGEALFEIPKPLKTKGIGIDQLPVSIRNSDVLTGNNLGRLGNSEGMPSDEAVLQMKQEVVVAAIIEAAKGDFDKMKFQMHQLAQSFLEKGEVEKALKTLLLVDTIETS